MDRGFREPNSRSITRSQRAQEAQKADRFPRYHVRSSEVTPARLPLNGILVLAEQTGHLLVQFADLFVDRRSIGTRPASIATPPTPSSAAAGTQHGTPYGHRARRTTVPAWRVSAHPPKRPERLGRSPLRRAPSASAGH